MPEQARGIKALMNKLMHPKLPDTADKAPFMR